MNTIRCPLCGFRECNHDRFPSQDIDIFECKYCGEYGFANDCLSVNAGDAWKIGLFTLEHNHAGRRPVFYPAKSRYTLNGDGDFVISFDHVLERFPKTVSERLDCVLINLGYKTKCLGDKIHIFSDPACPLLLARNGTEAFFVMDQLKSDGFIKGDVGMIETDIALTGKGFSRISDLQRGAVGVKNQAFVAMWFNDSLTRAWEDGIKPGISEAGYEPFRVDIKQHNNKICDVIVAEIRKSKFLVADFTGHRGGVYFEAGFMLGLGRQVIFTCKKEALKKVHFDTRQYNHIDWNTPEDLRKRLNDRIQATIL